jgi:aldehyde dehydrogenase (NAD+)
VKAGSEFSKMAEWDKWVISKEVLEQITDNIYAVDGYNKKYSREDILNGAIDNIGSEISFYEVKSGIVGGTNGFNYPAALAVPDIVLSRINGNSFVGKVPSKSPSFLFIRKIIENETINLMVERFGGYGWARDAKSRGIDFSDSNIVNIIKDGFQIIAGRQIIESWAKNCMTFRLVGGEIAGKVYHGYREEVDANLEKTILELAGNNPAVIMGSAKNLEGGLQKIVDNLAAGNKGNSGQRCTSPRRWLAHAEIYEELKDLIIREYRLSEKNGDNAIGNPLDESFKYGAMDKGGFDKAWEYLQEVTKLGALVIGGNRVLVDKFPDAYYMTPALVIWDNVPKDKQNIIHDKEIFAPIANLLIIHDVEHAIAESNKSIDKLSGGFYCDSDHQREFELFKSKTNLGSLIYNGPPKDQSPKGVHAGRERAGMGVTGGLDSIKQYQASPELIRKCSAKEAKEYIKKQMSVH